MINWDAIRRKASKGHLTVQETNALMDMAQSLEKDLLDEQVGNHDLCCWCYFGDGHIEGCPIAVLEGVSEL